MDKVYCHDCISYHTGDVGGACVYSLGHVDIPTHSDNSYTWRSILYAVCSEQNADNDCAYFKPKPVNVLRRLIKAIRDDK